MKVKKLCKAGTIASALVLLSVSIANAQEGAGSAPAGGSKFSLDLGAGAFVAPTYSGSRRSSLKLVPAIRASYGDIVEFSPQDGLTANVIRVGGITAGPLARLRFGRKESDDRTALRGFGDINPSAELGGFLNYELGPVSLRATLGQDVANGHKGAVGDLAASYATNLATTEAGPWLLSIGPTASFGSINYMRASYGVSSAQSQRSGRNAFNPGAGLESFGLSASLIVPITDRVSLTTLAGWSRLAGDAASSPLVRNGFGSANQVSGGLFLTYKIY